jgi:hypothetical protein
MPPNAPRNRTVALALLVDLACLALFVALGRNQHQENGGVAGFATTFATFAGAWLAAALLTQLHRNPLAWPRAAVNVALAVPTALATRIAFQDHSFKLSFTIVATVFVSLFTLGWRLLAMSARNHRAHTAPSASNT